MFTTSVRNLDGKPGLFLDFLRLSASLTVFVVHALAIWFPEYENNPVTSTLSHGAVVIFFVLSGFVIAHTTATNNRGAKQYAVARLSRLSSIFIPAIVITIFCSLLLYSSNPVLYVKYDRDNLVSRYLISLLYCNEIWFFSAAPLMNGPIWSLSYEFWYYIIFGCCFYKKKGAKYFALPVLACLIAGPKILVMMFMWLAGWAVYHLPSPKHLPFRWMLIFSLLVISIIFMMILPAVPYEMDTAPLFWASKFFSDWGVSLFIATALFLLPVGSKEDGISAKRIYQFRKIADLTFPLYVLHFPVLVLTKSCIAFIHNTAIQFAVGFSAALLLCIATGIFLESKRFIWNRMFTKLINAINNWYVRLKLYDRFKKK